MAWTFYAALLIVWITVIYSVIPQKLSRQELLFSANPASHTIGIIDFVHLYGSLAASAQTSHRVYDAEVQGRWIEALVTPLRPANVFYLEYVPFLFPCLIPLSLLSAQTAYLVWSAISVLALFSATVVAARTFSITRSTACLLFIGTLAALPCWTSFVIGQIAAILLVFVALYLLFLQTGKDIAAGAALAACSVKPHYAIFLAIPALVEKRWRLIVAAAVFELLLLTFAGLSIGWANIVNYPAVLKYSETEVVYAGLTAAKEVCIRGVFSSFLPDAIALAASMLAWLCGLVLVARISRLAKTINEKRWAIVLTIMLCLILSPHTFVYDWLLLMLVAAATSGAGIGENLGQAWMWWRGTLYSYPLLSWILLMLFNATGSSTAAALATTALHFSMLVLAWQCFRTTLRTREATVT